MNLKTKELLVELSGFLVVDNPQCPVCGRVLFSKDIVCKKCKKKLNYVSRYRCLLCSDGEALPETGICKKCKEKVIFIEKGASLFEYDEVSKQLVADFKFKLNKELAYLCGKQLAQFVSDKDFIDKADILVPVPLSVQKQKTRGYNQSEYIARGIAEITGNIVETDWLIKKKETADQIELNAEQRFENLNDAFAVIDGEVLKGKSIVLVDDVVTTGATLTHCAKTLLGAGALTVKFVAVACA